MDIERDFNHWLSGLLDGEGCFFARFYATESTMPLTLRVEITLRADDRAVLEHIQRVTGLGKVIDRPARQKHWAPTCIWRVSGRECAKVLDRLDSAPLRSKKARDYSLWREIVLLYAQMKRGGKGARQENQPIINQIEQLCQQLKEVRSYS